MVVVVAATRIRVEVVGVSILVSVSELNGMVGEVFVIVVWAGVTLTGVVADVVISSTFVDAIPTFFDVLFEDALTGVPLA